MDLQCVGGIVSGKFHALKDRDHLEVKNTSLGRLTQIEALGSQNISVSTEVYVEGKLSVAKVAHPREKYDWAVFRFLKPYRMTDAQCVELLLEKARKFDHLARLMGESYVKELLAQPA